MHQLRNLNLKISNSNLNKAKKRQMKCVSEFEWWAFWGIIFAACPVGKGGTHLFQPATGRSLMTNVDFGTQGLKIMTLTRHKEIKAMIPFAFYDYNCEEDPYHPVKSLIDGYNDNRKQNIAASIDIVLDESMSPYRPRTTSTGGLPNISFIFRKPKPLGIEMKVCVYPRLKCFRLF